MGICIYPYYFYEVDKVQHVGQVFLGNWSGKTKSNVKKINLTTFVMSPVPKFSRN